MGKVTSRWGWIKTGLAAFGALLVGLFFWGRQRAARKLGEQTGALREDRDRLREVAETGDDAGILDEWRRSRSDK
jgi:hypothetical protein